MGLCQSRLGGKGKPCQMTIHYTMVTVKQVVEQVVSQPLVNILRGAMSILVYIVSYPYAAGDRLSNPDNFGFRALKPAIAIHPQFLEMLVSKLSSADHALCANSMQLINSLMRDAITSDSESDWPKLVKRLQDLGVIDGVYDLMQSNAIQDLSQPLLEFQALTKVLLRKWRDLPVDLEKPDHRRALKMIHIAGNPEKPATPTENGNDDAHKKQQNPEKWRRLGFESESPGWEFENVGYLGMMDLSNYVRTMEDTFHKTLLEQASKSVHQRCPVARASLAVTSILVEHFEIDKADPDDAKFQLAFESKSNIDKIFRPLILKWSVLHTAGMQAFFRLWQTTSAEADDFVKIYDLVRILFEAVLGSALRTKGLPEVQKELAGFELPELRQLQMELLELTYEDTWGQHLRQIKDELSHEALQFVKEQRIRCLLAGAWFPAVSNDDGDRNGVPSLSSSFRYAKLSHNRRYLHVGDFETRGDADPAVETLPERIDLSTVTSVTSNVTAQTNHSDNSSTETLKTKQNGAPNTKITISGHLPSSRPNTASQSQSHDHSHSRNDSSAPRPHHRKASHHHTKEITLLTLHPQTQTLASEWLDGLLMLLNQQPITNETSKLIEMIKDYGLKIRLLNVRFDEMGDNGPGEGPEMPSREGVDDEFWYDDFGG